MEPLRRIYPAHLAVLVVAAIVFTLLPPIARGTRVGPSLSELLLLNAWWPHGGGYNEVSWSLSAEFFFYLVFPAVARLLVPPRRLGALVVATAVGAGLLFAWWQSRQGIDAANTAYFVPLARLPEFLLGVWLAGMVRAGRLPQVPVGPAAVLSVALLLVNWRFALPLYPVTDYVALPGFAVLIVAAA